MASRQSPIQDPRLTPLLGDCYRLCYSGYLGDRMEEHCNIVTKMALPRRVGDCFTNSLDSVLFLITFAVMLVIFAYVTALDNANAENQQP